QRLLTQAAYSHR
ncbi:hypothetical protein EC960939_4735, partial [Escherichia coli 96.0939]